MQEEKGKEKKLKQPTVYNCKARKPDLFSLPISTTSVKLENWIIYFKKLSDFLNLIARAENLPIEDKFDFAMIWQTLSIAEEVTSSNATDIEYRKMYVRVRLALYLMIKSLDPNSANEVIQGIITLLALMPLDQEMAWYYACALRYRAFSSNTFDEELIQNTIKCIKIINAKQHKAALYGLILKEYYPRFSSYPEYESLKELEMLFPKKPKLDGYCAKHRHSYIDHNLENKEYFDFVNTKLISSNEILKNIKITIEKQESLFSTKKQIPIQLTKRLLFKFASHIRAPSPPMLLISIPDIPKDILEEFNIELNFRLRTKGFCNSEGFIKKNFLIANFQIFKETCMDVLEEIIKPFSSPLERISYQEENFKLDFYREELSRLDAIRNTLSGLDTIYALSLFLQSLLDNKDKSEDHLLFDIENAVKGCLEIFFKAKLINDDGKISLPTKHKLWFKLSQEIVDALIKKPRNLLIAIGSPIKEGKRYSDHAIYVAIKNLGEHNIQIIITNGGDKAKDFHQISPQQHPKDRPEYQYAAFEPFKIEVHRDALIHYIYKLISLEYTCSINEDDENLDNPNAFMNLLKSVYLRTNDHKQEESFIGYQGVRFTNFKRQDLSECFLSQFTGNCTIHNLKKSLQILFDMDILFYGIFEDILVLNLDERISEYIQQEKVYSSTLESENQKSAIDLSTEKTQHISDDIHNSRLFATPKGKTLEFSPEARSWLNYGYHENGGALVMQNGLTLSVTLEGSELSPSEKKEVLEDLLKHLLEMIGKPIIDVIERSPSNDDVLEIVFHDKPIARATMKMMLGALEREGFTIVSTDTSLAQSYSPSLTRIT